KLTMLAVGLASLVIVLSVLVATKKSPAPPEVIAAAPPTSAVEAPKAAPEPAKPLPEPVKAAEAATTPPTDPAKAGEPRAETRADAKVLEPAPSAGQVQIGR